jgi:hypothetical protein
MAGQPTSALLFCSNSHVTARLGRLHAAPVGIQLPLLCAGVLDCFGVSSTAPGCPKVLDEWGWAHFVLVHPCMLHRCCACLLYAVDYVKIIGP